MEKIFEKALREKVRFEFKGLIGVEDLWDLNLVDLKAIYVALKTKLKSVTDIEDGLTIDNSLITLQSKEQNDLELKLDLVKYVFEVKKKEKEDKDAAKVKRAEKAKLLEILAMKEDEELRNMSADELKSRIAALD